MTETTFLRLQGCIADVELQPLAEIPQHAISGKLSLLLRDREETQDLWCVAWCYGEGEDAMEVVIPLSSLDDLKFEGSSIAVITQGITKSE